MVACHYFSFDTESTGNLPCTDGPSDRLFCTMSSPKTGTVFIFHDWLDIPQEIRRCLADYAISKIQSGIINNVKMFGFIGIIVVGLVDSDTLFLLIDLESPSYGARKQFEVLYPKKNCWQKYPWDEMPYNLENKHLRPKSRKHVIQEVLTPYATLFDAATKRAKKLC